MSEKFVREPLYIENAQLIFSNFSGKEGTFNKEGERNFCVVIDDPDYVDSLRADDWYLKPLKKRDEDDPDRWILRVKVSYEKREPRVELITKRGRTKIGRDEIGMLDWSEIIKADVVINPYNYTNREGNHAVSAYLSELYVTIAENRFEEKYSDLPYSD